MKKVICAAAAVLMVASLTACSGQSGESAAAGEGNTQQADGYPNKTIQVIVPFNCGQYDRYTVPIYSSVSGERTGSFHGSSK